MLHLPVTLPLHSIGCALAAIHVPHSCLVIAPDISKLNAIPGFAKRHVIGSISTLVCVFVNSIQQQFVSMITVNYTSHVALAKELRPFLLAKGDIPTSLMFPQEQLKATNVNVIEIFPPIVQIFSTAVELHDPKDQSDLMETIRGKPFGIPAEEFATKPMEKPLAGDDHIPVSLLSIAFNSWEQQR
ncbi:hypothetical protein V8F44DRAFT_638343 [Aspergillus fumigatus]